MARFNETDFLDLVRGRRRGVLPSLARLGLGAAAAGYGIGAGLRNLAYDRGWGKAHHAALPVVSVGNLTLGGTGKTPMVEWVCRWFRERAVRATIASRGYGGQAGLNDEGRVLEDNLPDVPHLQGRDRVELARIAVEELEAEVLVLDDGFQHRRLARDLDIVLLDALEPFGFGRLFPRGLLREPPSSLRRADVVVLTRSDLVDVETRRAIRERARRAGGERFGWVESRHAPIDLVDAQGHSHSLSDVKGKTIGAFCGIGNPEGFRRALELAGMPVKAFRTFPDHHAYTSGDVSDLARWARESDVQVVLTTQKDLVKLRLGDLGQILVFALRIGMAFLTPTGPLEEALERLRPGGNAST